MLKSLTGKRVFAAFVLGFLCLNAAGMLCLAACMRPEASSPEAAQVDSEHCRHSRSAPAKNTDDLAQSDKREAVCCIMPIGIIAAPVEKRSDELKFGVAPTGRAVVVDLALPLAAEHRAFSPPIYHPPSLDARPGRVACQYFRI